VVLQEARGLRVVISRAQNLHHRALASHATLCSCQSVAMVGALFEGWLCRACAGAAAALPHLLRQRPGLSLGPRPHRSCQRMARLKPALAELLLPHILADLARADADGRLAAVLSRQARQLR